MSMMTILSIFFGNDKRWKNLPPLLDLSFYSYYRSDAALNVIFELDVLNLYCPESARPHNVSFVSMCYVYVVQQQFSLQYFLSASLSPVIVSRSESVGVKR